MKKLALTEIVDCFARAASGRSLSAGKAWDYGWSQPAYRRSSSAAMTHDSQRAVSLDADAVAAFERGTDGLLRNPDVSERYDTDEFWSLTASLVGTLPIDLDRGEIERRVHRLLNPPDSLVVVPLANVAPIATPLKLGTATIGPFDDGLAAQLRAKASAAKPNRAAMEPWWSSLDGDGRGGAMTLAYECRAQSGRALREAEQVFDDTVSIALILEPDLDAQSLFSLRGDSHRPGTRGLVLDRGALTELGKTTPHLQRELGSPAIVSGAFGQILSYRWNGEAPFPLAKLLDDSTRLTRAERVLTSEASVDRRLRVAARWHAKAHWASDIDDAVLALGIALDAMLAEQSPSPGRALADRYAFLASDPAERRARYKEFQTEFYPARSSVAHGARKKSVDYTFVRRVARAVRWTFVRIVELSETSRIVTEDDYDQLYANLKWGGA